MFVLAQGLFHLEMLGRNDVYMNCDCVTDNMLEIAI